jgi:hypothetical protein
MDLLQSSSRLDSNAQSFEAGLTAVAKCVPGSSYAGSKRVHMRLLPWVRNVRSFSPDDLPRLPIATT